MSTLHPRFEHADSAESATQHRQPQRPQGLIDIRIDYGPHELLGRFFLLADNALRNLGVELTFGTFDELVDTNKRNRDSWLPIVPTFDPANGLCDPQWSYVLIGRAPSGHVVTAQGARVFDWRSTNFKQEAESLRLFFSDPLQTGCTREACAVTAHNAASLSGTIAFLGGAWWHPSVRGKLLGSLLSRVSRAYAYTRWHPDLTMAVMSKTLINKGFAVRNGYQHTELGFALSNFELGDYDGGVVWILADELLRDLEVFTATLDPTLDVADRLRRA